MIEATVNFLQVNVLPLGATGVFLASIIEEVFAPIPSALIMTGSGFLLVPGYLSKTALFALIFKVAIPAALGVTIGSYFVYFVARFGGRFFIEKWGAYLGLFWSDVKKIQDRLADSKIDEVLITGARILPIVPSVAISAFCGILAMSVWRYFVITFIGTFFRGLILGSLGSLAGGVYQRYAAFISSIEQALLLTVFGGFLVFVVLKYRSKQQKK